MEQLEEVSRCTHDKILYAAIDLIAEKGYKAVTTKEIAAASHVSEMTVFRHFGTKRAILEHAINRFSFSMCMNHMFSNLLQWDVEKDLLQISRAYLAGMSKNDKVFLVLIKEGRSLNDQELGFTIHPVQLEGLLTQYFGRMQELGKVLPGNSKARAASFIRMIFGAYVSRLISGAETGSGVDEEQFLEIGTKIFARGLTP